MSENIGVVSDDDLRATDFILVADHSGSMDNPSTRLSGRNRYEEMQEDAMRIAREAARYDDDGLTVIHFSSRVATNDGVTPDALANVFKEFGPRGNTATAEALTAAIDKVRSSTKNCVILVFTDGEANSTDDVIKVVSKAAKEFDRPRIGFIFIQIGNDPGAKAFLEKLDNGLAADVPDCVSTCSAEEAEELSLGNLAWMAQNV